MDADRDMAEIQARQVMRARRGGRGVVPGGGLGTLAITVALGGGMAGRASPDIFPAALGHWAGTYG